MTARKLPSWPLFLLAAAAAGAATLAGTNFQTLATSAGGGESAASTNFQTVATIAQPAAGSAQSANFKLAGGFTAQAYAPAAFVPQQTTSISPGNSYTITHSLSGRAVEIGIPQGAFAEAVELTVRLPASVPAPGARMTPLAGAVNLELSLNKAVQPLKDLRITLAYFDADAGGLTEANFVLARYDAVRALWIALPTQRDASANRISAQTDHLSKFQILQAGAAQSISEVTVGPNPLRPSRNPEQQMTFRNLSADARVRIYTYLGERLRELTVDGTGMAVWDGRNESGRRVASGVYLALIQGAGDKRIIRVAIER
ncbi:MAG: hypothetical protein ABIJ96_09595 [Elusimicrobiota bacterium]